MLIRQTKINEQNVISNYQNAGKQKNKTKKNKLSASSKALGAAAGVSIAACLPALLPVFGLKRINSKLKDCDKAEIKNAVSEILNKKGLSEKGVKLKDLRPDFFTENASLIKNLTNPVAGAANGFNAFYCNKNGMADGFGEKVFVNEAVCNMEKLPTAIFHELGHSFNANKSAFWKVMQSLRVPAMAISSGLVIFGALSANAEREKENGKLTKARKVKNFVRQNCGKLAFISMIPVLAEEGMASLRGNSWAEEFLSPETAKKVCTGNKVAYISYFATALGLGLCARAAVYVKDKIIDKNENQTC